MRKLALIKETLPSRPARAVQQGTRPVAGGTQLTRVSWNCTIDVTYDVDCAVGSTFHYCATTPIDQSVASRAARVISVPCSDASLAVGRQTTPGEDVRDRTTTKDEPAGANLP